LRRSNPDCLRRCIPGLLRGRTGPRSANSYRRLSCPRQAATRGVMYKFCLTEIRKWRMCRSSRPWDKGRFAIVTMRGPGGGGRGVHRRDGNRRAGLARERLRSAHTTGAFRVRQKRVVLTPGVCASRLAVMWLPDRACASVIRKATGAIVHRSPGRARHKPSNTAQGKAGMSQAALYAAVHLLLRNMRAADRGCQPAPGLPCALSLGEGFKRSTELGRHASRGREGVSSYMDIEVGALVPTIIATTRRSPRG